MHFCGWICRPILDTSGKLDGTAIVKMGSEEHPIGEGTMNLVWDQQYGVYVAGHLDFVEPVFGLELSAWMLGHPGQSQQLSRSNGRHGKDTLRCAGYRLASRRAKHRGHWLPPGHG